MHKVYKDTVFHHKVVLFMMLPLPLQILKLKINANKNKYADTGITTEILHSNIHSY